MAVHKQFFKESICFILILLCVLIYTSAIGQVTSGADPLPSWNVGAAKENIQAFVSDVTDPRSKYFIPVEDRIAVFDNDGTLWSEHPAYFQLFFALDRVKTLAPKHPEWKTKQPFKAALEGDLKTVFSGGEHAARTGDGLPCRKYHRRVRTDCHRVDRHRETPPVQAPLHRLRFPAHARITVLYAFERF